MDPNENTAPISVQYSPLYVNDADNLTTGPYIADDNMPWMH
jgi:hypothetical protein